MIANVVNTVISKVGLAIISILLLLLNSNFLGTEGLGAIGIIVLEISIYLLVVHLISGGSLIYFASRYQILELFLLSYVWIVLTAILFALLSFFVPIFSIEYGEHILVLGMIQGAIGIHTNLLVGKKKIKSFNFIVLLQAIVQITAVCIFYILLNNKTVDAFIYSTYIAYGLTFIYSLFRVIPLFEKGKLFPNIDQMKSLFSYGYYLQLANISQLLNYRLSYFLLNHFSGIASVGQFMPAVQISEGVLLPAKSIGIVQYSKISNTKSKRKSALLSIRLLKLVVLITAPVLLILLLLPSSFFTSVFGGNEFKNTSITIGLMGIGTMALACEIILSRFFSGTGNQKINASSSAIGLTSTIIVGFLLIPKMGLYGAAITSSISYLSMLLFLSYHLIKKSEITLANFLIGKSDYQFMKRIIGLNLKRKT